MAERKARPTNAKIRFLAKIGKENACRGKVTHQAKGYY
jgi:hypothetical protein